MIWVIIALMLVGTALITVECFIPGFGIVGLTGAVLSIVGLAMLVPIIGWYTVFAAVAEITLILIFVMLFVHSTQKGGNPLVLNARADKSSGFSANGNSDRFLGQTGVAECDLRPAGIATLCGERVDVVSDGEFIKKGSMLTVTEVNGRQIKVKKHGD